MKIKIAIIILTIAILAGYVTRVEKHNIQDAFLEIKYDEVSSAVEGFGEYKSSYATEEDSKNIIMTMADILEMRADREDIIINNVKGRREATLYKQTKNCDVTIEFITHEEEGSNNVMMCTQYVYVLMDFKNSTQYTQTYREVVVKMFDKTGVSGNVYTHYNGITKGNTKESLRDNISNIILKSMNAKTVSEYSDDTSTIIYAYSDKIDDSIEVNGKDINMNITVTYSEADDKTIYTLSTPINNSDF